MEHYYGNIDGWCNCEHLYKRMVNQASNGSVFVEVGVWKGKSASFMGVEIINSKKKIEFYAVDHFKGSSEHQNDPAIQSVTLKEECYKNLEPIMNAIKMLPIASTTAASLFADESIDFVYIDGGHAYEDVKSDIEAWYPKIKQGGTIAGDDYNPVDYKGVICAVDEFFPDATKEDFVWIYKKPADVTQG